MHAIRKGIQACGAIHDCRILNRSAFSEISSMSSWLTKPKASPRLPEVTESSLIEPLTVQSVEQNSIESARTTTSNPVVAVVNPVRTEPEAPVQERIVLWLRRADQLFLGFLLISLLLLLGAMRWKLSGGGRSEIEIVSQKPREYFYAIDINRSSWVEWAQLDGIGEKMARRIVSERDDHGPFRSIDDVGRVRGVGAKLLDKLRPFLKPVPSAPDEKQ